MNDKWRWIVTIHPGVFWLWVGNFRKQKKKKEVLIDIWNEIDESKRLKEELWPPQFVARIFRGVLISFSRQSKVSLFVSLALLCYVIKWWGSGGRRRQLIQIQYLVALRSQWGPWLLINKNNHLISWQILQTHVVFTCKWSS